MKLLNTFTLVLLVLFSPFAFGEITNTSDYWKLDSANSKVSFVTTKNSNISESHRFSDIDGHIVDGKATVTIKPDSVDSLVPIRNERMREFLFETGVYPTITVFAEVAEVINKLGSGTSNLTTIPASLSMHGVTEQVSLELRISKLKGDTLIVTSTESVLIRARTFNMLDGVNKLSSLVNNLPITETVPVNFSLQFKIGANSKSPDLDKR